MSTRMCSPSTARSQLRKTLPGDTLVMRDGVYPYEIVVPPSCYGMPDAPTTIRAEHTWEAIIDASGGYGDGIQCEYEPHDLVIEGLEIVGARTLAMRVSNGRGVHIRDCYLHHSVRGLLMYGSGCSLERTLIEFCGHAQLSQSGHQFGHGSYIHGDGMVVRESCVRACAGYGFNFYKESGGIVRPALFNSIVQGNLAYDQFRRSGLLVYGGDSNQIIGNVVLQNKINLDIREQGPGTVVEGNVESCDVDPWSKDFPYQLEWMKERGA